MCAEASSGSVRRSIPLHLLLIVLMLSGIGLSQSSCDKTAVFTAAVHHASHAAQAIHLTDGPGGSESNSGHGWGAICVTILAALAAGLLLAFTPRLLRGLAALVPVLKRLMFSHRTVSPALAQLCVLRA